MAMASNQPWWKGVTRYQWLVLAVAWMGWVFDIMDTALFNLAKTDMVTELLGGKEQYAAQGAAVEAQIQMVFIIGWAIGGLLFGVLADRWGRTRTLIATILIYCTFTGITYFCQSIAQVEAVRFVTGLGIGGEWAAGAALVAEVFRDRGRAPAASVLQTAAAFGPILAALANRSLADTSWRWLFVVGVFPAVVAVVVRFFVREPEATTGQTTEPQANAERGLRKWTGHIALAMIIGVVGIAGAGNISFWLPNLVQAVSKGIDPAVVRARQSDATMIMHIGTFAGVLLFPLLCERIGRKPAFALFFIASPLSVLAVVYGALTYGTLLMLCPLMSFFAIGLSAGFALYFPELFPTRIRATGLGLAYNTSRIVSAPVPWLTAALTGKGQSIGVGVARMATIYVVGLVALAFAPETKGKPLPEE